MAAKRKPKTKYGQRAGAEARYANGRLKPPGPNERVVEMRRALLTGGRETDAPVDITKAENALDVALARGWITEERHRATQRFASLLRRTIGAMPSLRQAKPLSDRMTSPAGLTVEERTLGKSGVLTPEDHALLGKLARVETTDRERTIALKTHRTARIDWSRLSSADLTAIFDAALMTGSASDAQNEEEMTADTSKLRALWATMQPEQARELFDVCVLGTWPRWITLRVFGRPVMGDDRRRQLAFEAGIDRVIEHMGVRSERQRSGARNWRTDDHHAEIAARRDAPLGAGPKREEAFSYVDTAGVPLFEVVKRRRTA